jgi:hypothetical protein
MLTVNSTSSDPYLNVQIRRRARRVVKSRDTIRVLVTCVNKINKINSILNLKLDKKTPSSTQNGPSFHRVIRPFRVPNKQQKFSYFGLPQNKLYNLISDDSVQILKQPLQINLTLYLSGIQSFIILCVRINLIIFFCLNNFIRD